MYACFPIFCHCFCRSKTMCHFRYTVDWSDSGAVMSQQKAFLMNHCAWRHSHRHATYQIIIKPALHGALLCFRRAVRCPRIWKLTSLSPWLDLLAPVSRNKRYWQSLPGWARILIPQQSIVGNHFHSMQPNTSTITTSLRTNNVQKAHQMHVPFYYLGYTYQTTRKQDC